MKLKVERKTSRSGKDYFCLVLDFGYAKRIVSFDSYLCAEVLNMSVPQMFEEVDSEVDIMKKEV